MSLKTFFYEKATDLANILTNPLATSKFLEEGVVTPEEFVLAGDLLVAKCATWAWHGALPGGPVQKGLPKEKQFLITRSVPCYSRAKELDASLAEGSSAHRAVAVEGLDGAGDAAEDWAVTNESDTRLAGSAGADGGESGAAAAAGAGAAAGGDDDDDDDDDIPEIDLEDLSIVEAEGADDAAVATGSGGGGGGGAASAGAAAGAAGAAGAGAGGDLVVRSRTYDMSITYDQFHQTPRVWLFGYDEHKQPLKPEEVLEDISAEHVNKTVTIANHPITGIPQAYIHPCKHAAVMKSMIDRMVEAGRVPRVDLYILIFLKFIHAAIPTIVYDFSFATDLG